MLGALRSAALETHMAAPESQGLGLTQAARHGLAPKFAGCKSTPAPS